MSNRYTLGTQIVAGKNGKILEIVDKKTGDENLVCKITQNYYQYKNEVNVLKLLNTKYDDFA